MVRKCALVGGFVLVLLMPGAASAATCTKTWIAGVGSWGVASNWSPAGVPTSSDSVCITNPGTYTVTMAPTDSGAVASLTLGAPTAGGGTQTLSVVGQSNLSGSSTTHQTVLILLFRRRDHAERPADPRRDGERHYKRRLDGRQRGARSWTITNAGEIVTQVEDSQWGTTLGPGTITNTGAIVDASGVSTTTATMINEGGVDVASGATDTIGASFANAGATANGGVTTVEQQSSTPIAWRAGGSEYGNPIELREGATLVDSGRRWSVRVRRRRRWHHRHRSPPADVTVRGEANDTTVSLAAALRRDRSRRSDPRGAREWDLKRRNNAPHRRRARQLREARRDRLGRVPGRTISRFRSRTNRVESLTSTVACSTTAQRSPTPVPPRMAPGAQWALTRVRALSNESNGELEPDVNGPSSYGTVDLTGGKLTAGGTLAPFLVEGYVPTANAEFRVIALSGGTFSGSFSKVLDGFTADYSRESSTPAFVGATYHKSSTPPPPPPKKAVLRVGPVKGGRGGVTVQLSCSGSGTCAAATIVVTAKHGRVVARAGATLKAVSSRTVTLKIKTKHNENVSVTVSAGGRRLDLRKCERERQEVGVHSL